MRRLARRYGSVLAVAAVYVVTTFGMPDGGSWVNDNGLKRIQVESIVRSGFESFAIDWPGREIDPTFAFSPITRGFALFVHGDLHASYSPVFALLSAPAYLVLGDLGLYLLPLLGAIAVLPAVRRLAIFAEEGVAAGGSGGRSATPTLAVLAAGLATPLWFYVGTFWEHAPAVALSTWSLVACLQFRTAATKRAAIVAGILLASPIYLRSDAYLLSALAGLAAVSSTRDLRALAWLGGAFVLTLAPLWLFHSLVFGNPLGPHIASQVDVMSFETYFAERTVAIQNFLVNAHANRWWSALAAAPFWLCVAICGGLSQRGFRIAIPAAAFGGLLAAAIVSSGHLTAARPMNWLVFSSGLFAACPLAILALVRRAPPSDLSAPGPAAASARRTLLAIVLADAVLLALVAPAINSTGVHWGNRFLLPLYPVLAVLACAGITSWARTVQPGTFRVVGSIAIAALALASLLLQAHSVVLLEERRSFSRELAARVVAADADLVVTDTWFLPMDLAGVFLETPIFFADAARRPELLRRAGHTGMRKALLIDRLTSERDRQLPPGVMRMRDEATSFSPVSLVEISLDPEPTGESLPAE